MRKNSTNLIFESSSWPSFNQTFFVPAFSHRDEIFIFSESNLLLWGLVSGEKFHLGFVYWNRCRLLSENNWFTSHMLMKHKLARYALLFIQTSF